MRVPFERLPGVTSDVARPALEVAVIGEHDPLTTLCLVDTGSLHNRFAGWVADLAGVDTSGVEPESIGVGGVITSARTVTVVLQLGEFQWEAPVSFCDPWPSTSRSSACRASSAGSGSWSTPERRSSRSTPLVGEGQAGTPTPNGF